MNNIVRIKKLEKDDLCFFSEEDKKKILEIRKKQTLYIYGSLEEVIFEYYLEITKKAAEIYKKENPAFNYKEIMDSVKKSCNIRGNILTKEKARILFLKQEDKEKQINSIVDDFRGISKRKTAAGENQKIRRIALLEEIQNQERNTSDVDNY